MNFKVYVMYFSILAIFTFWSNIGEAVFVSGTDGEVLNTILGFSVDSTSQGDGFIGTTRVALSYFTSTLPKWAKFNYSFLNSDGLQIVRWVLATIFGGTFVIMIAMSFIGILRRNF